MKQTYDWTKVKDYVEKTTIALNVFGFILITYVGIASFKGTIFAIFHPNESAKYAEEYYTIKGITDKVASQTVNDRLVKRVEAVKAETTKALSVTPTK